MLNSGGESGHPCLVPEFRGELTPTLLKLFQKSAGEGKLPNAFYVATITLIPNPDKDATKKIKLHTNITDGEGNGNLLQYSCLENPVDRGA